MTLRLRPIGLAQAGLSTSCQRSRSVTSSISGTCSVFLADMRFCRYFTDRWGELDCWSRRSRGGALLLRQATEIPGFRGFSLCRSPLTDSNRRPPPYHPGTDAGSAGTAGSSRPRKRRKPKGSRRRYPRVDARGQADVRTTFARDVFVMDDDPAYERPMRVETQQRLYPTSHPRQRISKRTASSRSRLSCPESARSRKARRTLHASTSPRACRRQGLRRSWS